MTDTKVTMILNEQDEANALNIKTTLYLHSNAAAVSNALAVTVKLIDIVESGKEILVKNKNGELEKLIFSDLT